MVENQCDTSNFQTLKLIIYFIVFYKQHIIDPSDLTSKIIIVLIYIILLIKEKEEMHMRWVF
jgi:hypothetical protein